jgi:hypothetical protein
MLIRTFFTNHLTLIITESTHEIHTAEILIISFFVEREREGEREFYVLQHVIHEGRTDHRKYIVPNEVT